MNEVYYRIYVNRENRVVVVCMQDFDEIDYDQSRFLSSEHFETEYLAWNYISENKDKLPSWVIYTDTSYSCGCLDR